VGGSTDRLRGQVGWLGLTVDGHLELSLHSSIKPGELSHWPSHDDSTINTVYDQLSHQESGRRRDSTDNCHCPRLDS